MAVTHAFTSAIEDGADETIVQPSDWNAAHALSNALKAIDGLTPAASKIAYFSGADAATLTDITATGISLLGAANAAGARTTLELGTVATQAASNVSLTGGSISGMTSIGGVLLSLASSSGAEHIFCKTNDTSNSNQSCIFVLRHYTSASEESATAFRLVSESGVNQLYLGGGALDHNACTMIKFFTASNYTTKYGTERGRVTNGGRWLFGTTTDDGVSIAQFSGTVSISDKIAVATTSPTSGSVASFNGNIALQLSGSLAGMITTGASINTLRSSVHLGLYSGGLDTEDEHLRVTTSGRILAGATLPTDNTVDALQVGGTILSTGYKLSALNTAPASASATGTLGDVRFCSDAIYICTATDTWKKVAIATW